MQSRIYDNSNKDLKIGDLIVVCYNNYMVQGIVCGVGKRVNNLHYYPITQNNAIRVGVPNPIELYKYWLIDSRASEKRVLKITEDQLSPSKLEEYEIIKKHLDEQT